jgi:16S rRNA (guanine527-N7)-methyltransferase
VPDAAPPDWDRFAGRAGSFGVLLTPAQTGQLQRYLELLCEWNRKFNLTAIERPEEILDKHFLDSLSCALAISFPAAGSLIDVGSGAGFPGLVLKIAFPHLELVLLDALEKRLRFLDRVVEELELAGVRTLHARAEDAAGALPPAYKRKSPRPRPAGPLLREQFDVVTARAVARLNVLVEWLLPFARVGGSVVAMKGPDVAEEVAEARPAIELLGGGPAVAHPLVLPGTDLGRSLVRIPKLKPTPRAYPRLPGTARKAPLGATGRA